MAIKNTTSEQTGIAVSTSLTVGGPQFNHAEGIVVSTAICAGPGSGSGGVWLNHIEGIVVSTAISAGPGSGSGGVWLNHAEGIAVATGLKAGPSEVSGLKARRTLSTGRPVRGTAERSRRACAGGGA